ncbi:MAG: HAMP domain-containing sensor histidine kinase [bacterium]
MTDFSTALRASVLFVGWPGMVVVSAFVVWNSWRFYQRVQRSAFGRLVLLMVTGWTLTMGVLALVGTLALQQDPLGAGAWAAAFLAFWAATMTMIVWIVHRWGSEAVTINLYYAELASMDRIKSQLINTVAHEINTPLTPILLKFSLLRKGTFGPLSKEQEAAVVAIERNLGRLQVLVEQVVLAMQIQTGRVRLAVASTAVGPWVEAIAGPFAAQAAADGCSLSVSSANGQVVMDPERMGRVLASFLSNALRHGGSGVHVALHAAVSATEMTVEVRDDGAGFTPEQGAVLFEPFRHARDPGHDVQAGAGLSLFLARGIVGLHHGRTWASSAGLGKGATFGFAIPLRASAGSAPR